MSLKHTHMHTHTTISMYVNIYKHLTVLSNYVCLTFSSSVSGVSKIHTINSYRLGELSYPENEGGKKKPTLELPDWSLLSGSNIERGEERQGTDQHSRGGFMTLAGLIKLPSDLLLAKA